MVRPTGQTLYPIKKHILLSTRQDAQLAELSAATGHTQAQIVRDLIQAAHAMRLKGHPHCASGGPCLCPMVHQPIRRPE